MVNRRELAGYKSRRNEVPDPGCIPGGIRERALLAVGNEKTIAMMFAAQERVFEEAA